MNIIINSVNTDNFKANTVQSNINVSAAEKITLENFSKGLITKSDTYSSSDLQLKNYSDLFSFVKKLLYNENFREIAINSNPELKIAYENFINAIKTDDSKLAEYIKSVLEDSGKFSGEFFNALNKIMSETNNTSLKSSIYEFLKIFDYYFSQNENASAVNSALNELLSKLPEDIKKYLLELLANSFDSKLNLFLISAFNTNLPDREKLKLILSYMLDLTDGENSSKDYNPLNILSYEQHVSTQTGEGLIKLIDTAINTLKNSNTEISDDIGRLLEALEEKLSIIKSSQNTDVSDKFIYSSPSQGLNEQETNINTMVKLIQSVTQEKSDILQSNIDDITKVLNSIKTAASFDDKNIINDIISGLAKIKTQNTLDISIIFDKIKNSILNNNSYPKDIKNQIFELFGKLSDNILEKLIFSDIPKNKCEMLLNIYEKGVMPVLLKNTDSLSSLTHNLMRLKLGTASEFNKQIKTFFNRLTYNMMIDSEQALNMKLNLIDKISEQQEVNEGMKAFLKLLDTGIKSGNNDLNKAAFENTILSMILKNSATSGIKHFFLPLLYDGHHVLSEIFLAKEKVKEEKNNQSSADLTDLILKITMILDIEEKGIFNTTLFYSEGQISAKIILPDNFSSLGTAISDDIKKIIKKNKLEAKNIVVSN